jgi:hypothetical protein
MFSTHSENSSLLISLPPESSAPEVMLVNSWKRVNAIEILGAMLEEACLKKGLFFQLTSTLFCKVNVKRGFVDR